MDILVKVAQLLLSLSILVLLHEFGHFFFAKLFKTRVEKFYLFFNPWFELFKFKKGDTEYGVGWLPLGGYVKISGMIDESMDKEQMKQPAQPWEFRSKPAWQRLLIMVGGVLVNFLLALFIYIGVLYTWGEEYIANKDAVYGISVDNLGQKMGFQNGDKIVSLDGKPLDRINTIQRTILFEDVKSVKVERNGADVNIPVDEKYIAGIIKSKGMFSPRLRFIVGDVVDSLPAQKAGIRVGDHLLAIDGKSLEYFDQYKPYFEKNRGKLLNVTLLRGKDTLNLSVRPDTAGVIGVRPDINQLKITKVDYGFFESFPAGVGYGFNMARMYFQQLKLIFKPKTEAYKSVGGFIAIGNFFPSVWDWASFWTMTAFLSIILAIMNILPIPALDGGHVMFLLYEIITRRKPSEKFMEYAQIVGMVILFSLLLFANGNDIVKLFH